jgi:hypothetical protein
MTADGAMAWLEQHEDEAVGRLMEWLRSRAWGRTRSTTGTRGGGGVVPAITCARSGSRSTSWRPAIPEKGHGRGQPVVFGHSPGGRGTRARGSCSTGTTTCSRRTRTSCGEPAVRAGDQARAGGRARWESGRGARREDDKGQVTMFLEAMRAWKEASGNAAGGVPHHGADRGRGGVGVGEPRAVRRVAQGRAGACDVVLISDTTMLGRGRPRSPTACAGWCTRSSRCTVPTRTCTRACGAGSARTR